VDRTWNENFGIRFAPSDQPSGQGQQSEADHLNQEVCPLFGRNGHCKFGNQCNKSHNLDARPANNTTLSIPTQQLNEVLGSLLAGIQHVKSMLYNDMQIGVRMELFAQHLNEHCQEINNRLTFATGENLLSSMLKEDQIQNMVNDLNQWWIRIASRTQQPMCLSNAIENLAVTFAKAHLKMTLATNYVAQGNFSNANPFQNGANNRAQNQRNPFNNNKNQNVSNNSRGRGKGGGNSNGNGNQWGNFNHNNDVNPVIAQNNQNFQNYQNGLKRNFDYQNRGVRGFYGNTISPNNGGNSHRNDRGGFGGGRGGGRGRGQRRR
jgi:hypothetical protein